MSRKRNAPGHKAEGVVCKLGGYIDAYNTTDVRVQYLTRFGIPLTCVSTVAALCFGEGRADG